MIETILFYILWGVLLSWGLYLNYMIIRDDIRREKECKAEKKREKENTTPLRRSR
ncbi:hypothetical protein [Streptococcus varani]|nr:hypothetical protein [Streptococcus varani]